ncbi:MAG: hypothetical protein B6245_14175 [Desulfobacteraceae bacterium 4572_88]|nr:MAG: hypothetical protein B6245_14175 [Desulfobacteraceae bacterium 4572_88]
MFLRSAKIKRSDFLHSGRAHAPPECASAPIWRGDQGRDAGAEMRLRRHAPAELAGPVRRIAKKRFVRFLHSGPGSRPAEIMPESGPNGKWLFFSTGGKLGYFKERSEAIKRRIKTSA